MLDLIEAAGWPIWLFDLYVSTWPGHHHRTHDVVTRLQVLPPRLPSQVMERLRQRNDDADAIVRLAGSSPLGRVLAEVLVNRNEVGTVRTAAVEDVGKDVAHHLNRYLPALATIAVVAPLMGLFGTVIGMIEIFSSYTPTGGDPAQLARGISIALYNTAFGIIIAIPALIFHRYFRSRVDHFLHRMEREASALSRLLDRGAGK